MNRTRETIETVSSLTSEAILDIKNGHLDEAIMQLDYASKLLGYVLSDELDMDAKEIFYKGCQQGIDDLEKRLDGVFGSLSEQISTKQCNLTQ